MDEEPRLRREAGWNYELVQPQIAPGSREEEQALAAIDAAREDEERELRDDEDARRRRHRLHWRRQFTPGR